MSPANRDFVKAMLAGGAIGCVLLVIGFADAGAIAEAFVSAIVGLLFLGARWWVSA